MINQVPLDIKHPRGIRNTQFRLPYLSNFHKMDLMFDDPYDAAEQVVRKTRKPGDPEIIFDPDGLYDEDDIEDDDPTKAVDLIDTMDHDKDLMIADIMAVSYHVSNQTRNGKIHSSYGLVL